MEFMNLGLTRVVRGEERWAIYRKKEDDKIRYVIEKNDKNYFGIKRIYQV